ERRAARQRRLGPAVCLELADKPDPSLKRKRGKPNPRLRFGLRQVRTGEFCPPTLSAAFGKRLGPPKQAALPLPRCRLKKVGAVGGFFAVSACPVRPAPT